ncbi:hypothetical protein Rsub_05673 [Raphidocelis subcapitata]|uniref:Uncharacterized protein n=1 Tax=Raphidocelis subcapitata TaxID=307507 RepID=A0A2V0P2E2_9CHLO|nr:hypothetical protein Rsub_05673 [Raphidocelis subcapitata]|eukprot:GBF93062.1 hypothetical protein Rsub_05673 [Raphidocelis subcapitata]
MAGAPTATYRVDPDGVAVISLSNAPVNALHPDVLRALFSHAAAAHADPSVRAIVVTGAGANFSAGFDINQFVSASGGGGIDGSINDAICAALESGPKPTVAAVSGVALGGGLEVAMGCNARVVAEGARMGLPELQLGIIPGFGGTQRLPRLVGLQKAIEMMLTSAPIKAEAAKKLGLADALAAKQHALDIAAGKAPRNFSLTRGDKLEPLGEALAVVEFARAQAAKRARHLKHPQLCLDAIQAGITDGGAAGLKKARGLFALLGGMGEGECFAAAAALDTHKALVHIFFAQRSTKKVRGVTDAGLKPRPMRVVAVLGGGLMGSGIATALALAGVDVILKEVNQQFLDGGMGRVKANLASRVKKGKMAQAAADATLARVKGSLDYASFGSCDMVIEAVIEDIPLKQRIFADLEAACRPDAILATNTSTIDIDLVGAKTRAQDRIVGAHFFSPAHIMPLLEIVRTKSTSKQVVLDTLALAGAIKKTPVVVGNCTGFAVNRVDAVIAGEFGMPMGPFRLNDLVGSDIGLHVGRNFVESFSERVYVSHLIPSLNDAKRLGEKTGAGFYKGIVEKPADLDVASVMAMGFPPFRGGLIFWADLVGAPRIVAALDALSDKFAPAGAGGFFKPCDYLRSAAAAGRKLSAGVVASRM